MVTERLRVRITYRPAQPADLDFLFDMHRATTRRLVEDTWGQWDEPWQRQRFEQVFKPEELLIIQAEGADVGVLRVQDRAEEIFLAVIEILPAYQKRGIGTQVIRQLLARAERQQKPVALRVLKANVDARRLYQRLGFGVTGETETHYILACYRKA